MPTAKVLPITSDLVIYVKSTRKGETRTKIKKCNNMQNLSSMGNKCTIKMFYNNFKVK